MHEGPVPGCGGVGAGVGAERTVRGGGRTGGAGESGGRSRGMSSWQLKILQKTYSSRCEKK